MARRKSKAEKENMNVANEVEVVQESVEAENTVQNNTSARQINKEIKHEIKNNMVFPKNMKLKISYPLATILLFVIALCLLSGVSLIGYYIYDYGIDCFFDNGGADDDLLIEYRRQLVNYEQMVSQNQLIIMDYEKLVAEQREEMDSMSQKLDQVVLLLGGELPSDFAEGVVSGNIAGLENDTDNLEEPEEVIPEKTAEDVFCIYYPEDRQDEVEATLNYLELSENPDILLVSYNLDSEDGEKAFIEAFANTEAAECPDIIFLKPEMQSDILELTGVLSTDDLNLSDDIWENYALGEALGLDNKEMSAFYYELSPGYLQIKADLAEEYFGTTDPDELYEDYFCDMKTFVQTAKDVYKKSKGKVALISGINEIQFMYDHALDDADMDFKAVNTQLAKSVYKVDMMSEDWTNIVAGKDAKRNVICSLGCPESSRKLLGDTDYDNNNLILVQAPMAFSWGGQGMLVSETCSDVESAELILDALLTDKELGLQLNKMDNGFINNPEVISNRKFSFDLSDYIYGEQDYIDFIERQMYME